MRLRILSVLILLSTAAAQDEPVTFKAARTEVRLDVQVVQNKRVVADLTRQDFIVEDESKRVEPSYFGREAEPLTLVLLLDISGSMRRFVDQMSAATYQALRNLRAGDRVAVMVYGRRPQLHLDFSSNFDEIAAAVRSATSRNDTGAGTSTNEAVIAAAKLLVSQGGQGRRAILAVTDNGGVNEGVPDEQAIGEMFTANAVFNAIAVGKAERPKPPTQQMNAFYTSTDVFTLAEATGGEAVRAAKADAALAGMLERIRARYAIAYALPADTAAGAFRKVRVTVKGHPNAEVRVRRGYYAPAALAATP